MQGEKSRRAGDAALAGAGERTPGRLAPLTLAARDARQTQNERPSWCARIVIVDEPVAELQPDRYDVFEPRS